MSTDDVVAVAEAVYAVPAAEFVAERKRRAAAARQDGDRDLAARIAALPKASASAALIDRLVHDAPDDLLRVLRLGADLREAQEAGDRQRLRTLTADRRHLLDEVAAAAADRAEQDGRRPGAAVLEEFQQTLQAAMTSDAAAAAVRSGRLVRALSADGLEAADLHGAVAPEGTLPEAAPLPPAAPGPAEAASSADTALVEARRRRAEAEQQAAEARQAADEAEQAAEEARAEADERATAVDAARDRVEALRTRLQDAEADLADARSTAESARKTASRSADTAAHARAAADAAEASLLQEL